MWSFLIAYGAGYVSGAATVIAVLLISFGVAELHMERVRHES